MNSLNKVMLIGRIIDKPSLRSTRSGTSVTNFIVETKEMWNNNTIHSERHDITAFGKVARLCVDNWMSGRLVYIEGKMQNQSIGVNAINAYRTNVIAHAAKFFDAGPLEPSEDAMDNALSSYPIRRNAPKKARALLNRAIPPFICDRARDKEKST
jgi:single stranded DNA-binding protein